ncbi:hypothetical protein BGLY_2145 [Bacillus glycinifermentans]|nr:hypothetical protein BGLY_2145 [Bacillus glycinifermentans]
MWVLELVVGLLDLLLSLFSWDSKTGKKVALFFGSLIYE